MPLSSGPRCARRCTVMWQSGHGPSAPGLLKPNHQPPLLRRIVDTPQPLLRVLVSSYVHATSNLSMSPDLLCDTRQACAERCLSRSNRTLLSRSLCGKHAASPSAPNFQRTLSPPIVRGASASCCLATRLWIWHLLSSTHPGSVCLVSSFKPFSSPPVRLVRAARRAGLPASSFPVPALFLSSGEASALGAKPDGWHWSPAFCSWTARPRPGAVGTHS